MTSPVTPNPWAALRRLTPARIALGRSGISQPTAAHLDFQLAHAQARDAVHRPLEVEALAKAIEALGLQTVGVQSAAPDRQTYLQRPDLGRRLGKASSLSLWERAGVRARPCRSATAAGPSPQPSPQRGEGERFDLALVVADGLSALAVERQAVPFLAALLPQLTGWCLAPVVIVQQGRVAIGDEIGERLGARCVLVLIGERPGLSSPDSLGLYLTWAPRVGRHDAERNCISNVRPEGLPPAEAARRAAWLLDAARTRGLSGVALKDESAPADAVAGPGGNFLLGPPSGDVVGAASAAMGSLPGTNRG